MAGVANHGGSMEKKAPSPSNRLCTLLPVHGVGVFITVLLPRGEETHDPAAALNLHPLPVFK